ncbi:MAG: hypothetical protein Q9162_001094 [Coniocarpon cinnabarinum]
MAALPDSSPMLPTLMDTDIDPQLPVGSVKLPKPLKETLAYFNSVNPRMATLRHVYLYLKYLLDFAARTDRNEEALYEEWLDTLCKFDSASPGGREKEWYREEVENEIYVE